MRPSPAAEKGLATDTVGDAIAEAREAIERFDDTRAARILGRAVHMTGNGDLLEEIYELALQGSRNSKAGRTTKAMRWDGVIKAAEQRLEAARERRPARSAPARPELPARFRPAIDEQGSRLDEPPSTAGTLRGEIVTDEGELAEVVGDWDRLAVERGQPYAAPAWMLSWWRHAAPPGSGLRVVVVRNGDTVTGIAPLYAAQNEARFSSYRTLGVGSFREPLAAGGAEREVAAVVAEALAASEPRPRCISLEAMAAASPWADALLESWPSRRPPRIATERIDAAPELELPGSFDEWFAAASGHFRKRMRSCRRRLDSLGAQIRQAESGDMDRALECFARLHRSRWRHRGGSTALRPSVERMARDAAAQLPADRFRLWLIELDGEIVCTEILLAAGGVVSSWLGGFDERIAAHSPSLVTILAATEHSVGRGDRRLDLGPGRQEWKYRFSGGERELAWVTLVPPGPGSLRVRSRVAATRLKRELLERLPEPHRVRLTSLKRKVRGRSSSAGG